MNRLAAARRSPVLRAFSSLATGSMIGLMLSFVVQAYLSRKVTVDVFGQINYARIVIGYFILALNFGFETYFLRALVGGRLQAGQAVGIQLSARLPVALLAFLGLVVWASLGGWTAPHVILVLYGITTLAYVLNLDWLFQVRERFSALAIANVGRGVLILICTVLLVHNAQDALQYVMVVAFAEVARVAYQWWLLRPKPTRVSTSEVLTTLRTSIAISASFFMISLYYNVDSLMLGHFKGDATVGIYVAAYNILTLAILPTTLLYQAFGPTLARSPWDFKIFKRYVTLTMLLAGVVFLGLILLHRVIILTLYGEKYLPSVPVLLFLSFNVLTSYAAGAFANPINIWGQYIQYLWIVSVGAGVNILLNLLLIPHYGILAAVGTTIFSELVVAFSASIIVLRGLKINSPLKQVQKV